MALGIFKNYLRSVYGGVCFNFYACHFTFSRLNKYIFSNMLMKFSEQHLFIPTQVFHVKDAKATNGINLSRKHEKCTTTFDPHTKKFL